MHYRHYVNNKRGVPNLLMRDKDELIASAISGTLVGGSFGGSAGIPAYALVYGVGCAAAQWSYTLLRHWRLRAAMQQRDDELNKRPRPQTMMEWWRSVDRFGHVDKQPQGYTYDPVGEVLGWIRSRVMANFDVPAYLSPLVNAVDVEYRVRLNTKADILKVQIENLEAEITAVKKEKGIAEHNKYP
ncbi:hypothetical protein HK101_001583 [Irineochytrium annulatum]|nr:hypothetical protein HK101_001583 [Irineochytrium annulatum]